MHLGVKSLVGSMSVPHSESWYGAPEASEALPKSINTPISSLTYGSSSSLSLYTLGIVKTQIHSFKNLVYKNQ